MRIKLSDHFTYKKLLMFVLPSVTMMVVTSVYSVVDGFFVSNYAGKTSFAAVNLIMPLLMILSALCFMIGTGGSAVIGKTLGEKNPEDANRYFSMYVYVTFASGLLLAVLGEICLPFISVFLGAEGQMLQDCILYGRIILLALPFFMLENIFQSFFVVAEKPKLGLLVILISGIGNIILDVLFIAVFSWGLKGAAWATAICQTIGGVIPIVYFSCKNDSLLSFCKTKLYGKVLARTCLNGSSEMVNNIAMSIITVLYNYQFLRLVGEDGVAAYGVIMYVGFVFFAIMIGYAIGSAPLISYSFGAQNHIEMKNLLKKNMVVMLWCGVFLTAISFFAAKPLVTFFVGYDENLLDFAIHGMKIYAFIYLLCGINIFGSSFFTALNNGVISAVMSFLRVIVFECLFVLILPYFFGVDGIWCSALGAEVAAFFITAYFIVTRNKKYKYWF